MNTTTKVNQKNVEDWMKSVLKNWISRGRQENDGTWIYEVAGRLSIVAGSCDPELFGDDTTHLEFKIATIDDFPDYEWCYMPSYKDDGEVWDTESTADSLDEIRRCSKWLTKNLTGMLNALKNGEITSGNSEWDEEIIEEYFGYEDEYDGYFDAST